MAEKLTKQAMEKLELAARHPSAILRQDSNASMVRCEVQLLECTPRARLDYSELTQSVKETILIFGVKRQGGAEVWHNRFWDLYAQAESLFQAFRNQHYPQPDLYVGLTELPIARQDMSILSAVASALSDQKARTYQNDPEIQAVMQTAFTDYERTVRTFLSSRTPRDIFTGLPTMRSSYDLPMESTGTTNGRVYQHHWNQGEWRVRLGYHSDLLSAWAHMLSADWLVPSGTGTTVPLIKLDQPATDAATGALLPAGTVCAYRVDRRAVTASGSQELTRFYLQHIARQVHARRTTGQAVTASQVYENRWHWLNSPRYRVEMLKRETSDVLDVVTDVREVGTFGMELEYDIYGRKIGIDDDPYFVRADHPFILREILPEVAADEKVGDYA